ncbi:MAG: hypothetical protein V3S14_00635, partial [Anaerolineae bacterium]
MANPFFAAGVARGVQSSRRLRLEERQVDQSDRRLDQAEQQFEFDKQVAAALKTEKGIALVKGEIEKSELRLAALRKTAGNELRVASPGEPRDQAVISARRGIAAEQARLDGLREKATNAGVGDIFTPKESQLAIFDLNAANLPTAEQTSEAATKEAEQT